MPGYYVTQSAVMPIPIIYGYFSYPQVSYNKMPPRRYQSSKQQIYPGVIPPSVLLESEVSTPALNRIKEYEKSGDIGKLAGEICKLARLQTGSRFLQKEVEKGSQAFLTFILNEVWAAEIIIDR